MYALLGAVVVMGLIKISNSSGDENKQITNNNQTSNNTDSSTYPSFDKTAKNETANLGANDESSEKTDDAATDPQATLAEAAVSIVDASQYGEEVEVRAFVGNIIAEGTCWVVFTMDREQLSKEVSARPDASTSICETLVVPRSEFASTGVWSVEVIYTNDSAKGSATTSVEIK